MNPSQAHEFFRNISVQQVPQKESSKEEKIYMFNTLLFEIDANFDHVIELVYKYKNGLLKNAITQIDAEWIKFILTNEIDIAKYADDKDKFMDEFYQKITE